MLRDELYALFYRIRCVLDYRCRITQSQWMTTVFRSLKPLRCQGIFQNRIKWIDRNHLVSQQFQWFHKMQSTPYLLYRSIASKRANTSKGNNMERNVGTARLALIFVHVAPQSAINITSAAKLVIGPAFVGPHRLLRRATLILDTLSHLFYAAYRIYPLKSELFMRM